MKKIITSIIFLVALNATAQIGGGWDWAFNTGSVNPTYNYLKYNANGSEIYFAGSGGGSAYFGSTTLTSTPTIYNGVTYLSDIQYFGKINSATGVPTILKSFNRLGITFNNVTTDNSGNFYIGATVYNFYNTDLGNGIIIPASAYNTAVVAKFDASGNALWAKTFQMGATGSYGCEILKLAVTNAGNIYFWGRNPNTVMVSGIRKENYPLYKLDSNGNTIWFKNAFNVPNTGVSGYNTDSYINDKFIDDNENVHLFLSGSGGFAFDGVNYSGGGAGLMGASTLISLDAAGTIFNAQTFNGTISNFQVDRTSGDLLFSWVQSSPNTGPFANLPYIAAYLGPQYTYYFNGIIRTTNTLGLIKFRTDNNPNFQIGASRFIALPNGKLILSYDFGLNQNFVLGVNSFYPLQTNLHSIGIVETDTDWNLSKFITGGKAPSVSLVSLAAYNTTYVISAIFSSVPPLGASTALPTTMYGNLTLTGMNADPNLTSQSAARTDVAIAQCKSQNFPTIASTTWLGTTNNWNTPSNWSNGVPTSANKAVFSGILQNSPIVSTNPVAATLEVMAGTAVNLPKSVALLGGLKNDGTIQIDDAGTFNGLGTYEWRGTGSLTFSGTAATFGYAKSFTNSLIINTDVTIVNDTSFPTITFNSGKFNLNAKKVTISNPSPTAVSGTSTTSYFYGGTLERTIASTGMYEFAVGTTTNFQSATINANNLIGTTALATTFMAGAITGTTPATSLSGVTINSALNAGWFTITPNNHPLSGTYDVTVKLQNSTNSVPTANSYIPVLAIVLSKVPP